MYLFLSLDGSLCKNYWYFKIYCKYTEITKQQCNILLVLLQKLKIKCYILKKKKKNTKTTLNGIEKTRSPVEKERF
jgi:hypothetical protein